MSKHASVKCSLGPFSCESCARSLPVLQIQGLSGLAATSCNTDLKLRNTQAFFFFFFLVGSSAVTAAATSVAAAAIAAAAFFFFLGSAASVAASAAAARAAAAAVRLSSWPAFFFFFFDLGSANHHTGCDCDVLRLTSQAEHALWQ